MSKLTEIIFIIDKSGSMYDLVDDTIGGFNGFVESQKNLEGEAMLTTVLFSTDHTKIHNRVDIREVPAMDRTQYVAAGMTAMLDAIGETIQEVQDRIDDTPAENRPDNVMFVVITDGQENASRTYKKAEVQRMIEHQTKGHNWQFLFLGANMDAVKEASDIGIHTAATYTADSLSTKAVYNAIDCAASSYRATGAVDVNWSDSITSCAKAYIDEDVTVSTELSSR